MISLFMKVSYFESIAGITIHALVHLVVWQRLVVAAYADGYDASELPHCYSYYPECLVLNPA